MKTAMQELIEWGDEMLLKHPQKILGFGEAIDKAVELLKKEKEQIIDAYYGNIDGVYGYREAGEKYYNQTYNQNK
jgi:aromatic ring-opening dioxygenase LigB subunit